MLSIGYAQSDGRVGVLTLSGSPGVENASKTPTPARFRAPTSRASYARLGPRKGEG
jgi:hypothetical protein